MSATILPFAPRRATSPPQARAKALASVAERFGAQWTTRHMPLVTAALDMLAADNADFAERCRLISREPGALVRLVDKLARLASHLHDVAEALAMTAQRIRAVPANQPRPA